jgi:predicted DNA-binding protein (UPF0251 family)
LTSNFDDVYYEQSFKIEGDSMPRPRKKRRVGQTPLYSFYKPQGVPMEGLTGVNLTVEGLEAMRLADAEAREHDEAAGMMGVSRPTFSRVLNEARAVVARALSNGWAIHIDGGNYRLSDAPGSSPGSGCRRRSGPGCAQRRQHQAMPGGGSQGAGPQETD